MLKPRRLAIVLVATALTVPTALGALHFRLTKSLPTADAALPDVPGEIRLWFSQNPELKVSAIRVAGTSGPVALGEVHATDDAKSIAASVQGTMPPGTYTVRWRSAGDDGHVLRGDFRFTVTDTRAAREQHP